MQKQRPTEEVDPQCEDACQHGEVKESLRPQGHHLSRGLVWWAVSSLDSLRPYLKYRWHTSSLNQRRLTKSSYEERLREGVGDAERRPSHVATCEESVSIIFAVGDGGRGSIDGGKIFCLSTRCAAEVDFERVVVLAERREKWRMQ
ncbi:hypothetical protein Dimus_000689 [Dionaea muscipula]